MTKNIIIIRKIFLSLAFFTLFLGLAAQAATYNYTTLEALPGSYSAGTSVGVSGTGSLPNLIQGIYNFGIGTVGIAALLMISIGGFMYMTSAGNTSKIGTAKGIIADAIYGLIVAMGAYLLLYVINPDLITIFDNLSY